MSKNINQLTVDTTVNTTDKFYKGNAPYNSTDDRAVLWSSIIATMAGDFYNANVVTHNLTPLQLTQPLANIQVITLTNTGTLKLPAMNGQTPSWKGRSILIFNNGDQNITGATAFNVYAQDGTTVLYPTLQYQQGVLLNCTDDTTANGTFTATPIPNQRFKRFIQDGGSVDTTFLNAICEASLPNDAYTAPLIGTAGMYTGFNFILKNNSSTNLTFTPTSPNTIDGARVLTLAPTESAWIVCNGSSWGTIALSRAANPIVQGNLQCIGNKNKALPTGVWTTVASYSGGSGILKRIWIATNGNPPQLYLNITFDGASSPQWGSNITSGFNNANSLQLDVLFTAGSDKQSYWAAENSGCNILTNTQLGGYIAFDMPFSSSFQIQIFNASVSDGSYWCQAFYELVDAPPPYRLYAKPFNFSSLSNTTTVFEECPLLNVAASNNGIIFKGTKCFMLFTAGTIGWQEGKFRAYYGGPGMSSPQNYTAATPSDLSYYNQQTGVTQTFQSTGTEDFFMSSYNFAGNTLYANNSSGVVLNQSALITAYRYFNESAPSAPSGQPFVFTWTCGDQNTPTASSISTFLGVGFYYA